jgi:(p)ppGpp synthase/HD superfamily hydrolase
MHYSYRIEQALRASAILHKDQVRKGEIPYPYITHTVAVALIVSDYTQNEDVIVSALLHDTLEDTDYTREELHEDFGPIVRTIVESVTNPEAGEDETWTDRKKQYIKQLKEASEEALIVAAGDKIHNMRTMVEAYYDREEELLADFGGSLEERLTMYQEISNVFNRQLKSAILTEFNHVFEEFKQFVLESEKKREAHEAGYRT